MDTELKLDKATSNKEVEFKHRVPPKHPKSTSPRTPKVSIRFLNECIESEIISVQSVTCNEKYLVLRQVRLG